MNSDSPKTPREEMEAWLTSYLLGELSEGEAAAVRELIAHDRELSALHDRLKQAIVLVREAAAPQAASSAAPAEPLKLSDGRREKLLAHFKTIKPREFTTGKPRRRFTLVELAAVLAIIGVLAAMLFPAIAPMRKRPSSVAVTPLPSAGTSEQSFRTWGLERAKPADQSGPNVYSEKIVGYAPVNTPPAESPVTVTWESVRAGKDSDYSATSGGQPATRDFEDYLKRTQAALTQSQPLPASRRPSSLPQVVLPARPGNDNLAAGGSGEFGGRGRGEGRKGGETVVTSVGDADWFGVLETPVQPHSTTNAFVARYAFTPLPNSGQIENQSAASDFIRPAMDPTTGLPVAMTESGQTQNRFQISGQLRAFEDTSRDSTRELQSQIPPSVGFGVVAASNVVVPSSSLQPEGRSLGYSLLGPREAVESSGASGVWVNGVEPRTQDTFRGRGVMQTDRSTLTARTGSPTDKVPVLGDLPGAGETFYRITGGGGGGVGGGGAGGSAPVTATADPAAKGVTTFGTSGFAGGTIVNGGNLALNQSKTEPTKGPLGGVYLGNKTASEDRRSTAESDILSLDVGGVANGSATLVNPVDAAVNEAVGRQSASIVLPPIATATEPSVAEGLPAKPTGGLRTMPNRTLRLPAGQSVGTPLVEDGKRLLEAGKFGEAERKFKDAINADPENRAAFYYMRIAGEENSAEASRLRETRPKTVAELAVALDKSRTSDVNPLFDGKPKSVNEALSNYAELTGRKLLGEPRMSGEVQITLNAEKPLTKAQTIQALEAALHLNGISTINIGDKYVTAVPVASAGMESAQSLDGKIRDAQDQTDQLRRRLDISDADAGGVAPAPLIEADTLRRLDAMRAEKEAQYLSQEKQLAELKAVDKSKWKDVLPQTLPDPALQEFNGRLSRAEERLVELKKNSASGNQELAQAQAQVNSLKQKTDDRAASVVAGLEQQVHAQKAQLDKINESVKQATTVDREKAERSRPYYEKKRELEELSRLRTVLMMKVASENIDMNLPKSTTVEIIDRAVPSKAEDQSVWQKLGRSISGGYKSAARIKVERDVSEISGFTERGSLAAYDPYFVQTEFETIQSEPVLGKVVDALKLDETWAGKGGGKLKKSDAIALLKKKLALEPVKNTSLVQIQAKSDKPEEAAKLANAVAEAYRNYRKEQIYDRTVSGIKALEERSLEQDEKVRRAQEELEKLRVALNVSDDIAAGGVARTVPTVETDVAPVRKPSTNAPIPQPEIQTSENNFSTFSLNVSDVSFKLAAASLEKGQMPDAASVRSEEFINAFDYRDPEPAVPLLGGDRGGFSPIAFAWERARYPFAHNRDLLRFSLKTAAAGRQAGRPLNLVLLLDNSGSMERADRVQIIREALRVLAGQLQPQDKLSVITFARTARLVADGAPGSDAGAIAMAVSEITPQGGTNLEDAMNLAYQTAAKHYLANGINRVVLLTDGAANLGDVEPDSLKQKVEAQRKQGIALDCFGIGWEGFNDDLLEVLSRNGDGRYGFINSSEEAATDFVGQLAGALKVAASDVKVQVEFNPKRVTSYRRIGYAKHQLTKEQFRDNTVDAAEIAAQEAGNALYTVEVNPAGAGPLCTVRVRYKIPGTSDYREQAWDVPYTGNALSLEQSSPAMRLAASASAFSEWLVASPFAGEVTPDRVLGYLSGVPEVFGADGRPKKLEWMIRQAKSIERR